MSSTRPVRLPTVVVFSLLLVLLASMAAVPSVGAATKAKTKRVSVNSAEVESAMGAIYPSISATGRFSAFETDATNLVKNDTNMASDVFVRDKQAGTTERVSVRSNGNQGNDWSGYSAISANGRFVTFTSQASNMVKGDGNAAQDVFVHDRRTGVTTRISVRSNGHEGNDDSAYSSISASGRYVAFASDASNLVKGDTNGYNDLFLHDRRTGRTTLISVRSNGNQANAGNGYISPGTISGGGRFIAFASNATNLVPGDTNGFRDVFVHDAVTGKTTRVSVSSAGTQANGYSADPSMAGGGRFVSFSSDATNLVGGDSNAYVDIFVHDLATGKTRRVSFSTAGNQADASSGDSSISAAGRYVVFRSFATNLIGGDSNGFSDIFIRDRKMGTTRRVSVSNGGAQGNSGSDLPYIAAGGRYVVFQSSASNLVGGDGNGAGDVFVRGPLN